MSQTMVQQTFAARTPYELDRQVNEFFETHLVTPDSYKMVHGVAVDKDNALILTVVIHYIPMR